MEKLAIIPIPEENISSKENPLKEKAEIFEKIVENDIIQAFANDLSDAGFEQEHIQEFEKELSLLDESSIKGVLSLPKELRVKNFPKYLETIENDEKTIQELVKELSSNAQKHGYSLGYHATNNEIIPNGSEWSIIGYEFDDRDERSMAYYSLDYTNIFRSNRFKFLYIVRAQIGENSEHKRDTSNNWGRAGTLSIVHKINLPQTDEEVERIYSELHKNKSAA